MGSYPNVFWDVKSTQLKGLVRQAALLSSEDDYRKLLDSVWCSAYIRTVLGIK
jgi:hypothetical protein